MKNFLRRIIYRFTAFMLSIHQRERDALIYSNFGIPSSVRFWDLSIEGNVEIGENTYLNDGCRIDSGSESKVIIGSHCAIGRYVHITSKTHDLRQPTTSNEHQIISHIEKDTTIGNYVWIGDKVLINQGVTVGDYAVIGANSVVINDVKSFEIVGGVPAKHIRLNKKHKRYPE